VERALASVFEQAPACRVAFMDGGSRDDTLVAVTRWRSQIAEFRSGPDGGQAAAINEGLASAETDFVAWLNADDVYRSGGLGALISALDANPSASFAYGDADLIDWGGNTVARYRVSDWSRDRFARRCFVAQPATLIRRSAWLAVGGLDASLHMALDYDLWWRLAALNDPVYVHRTVAATRIHPETKTMSRPIAHYREAMSVVRRHYGKTPLWWWLKMPWSVGARALLGRHIGYAKPGADARPR
jgi:GT2 family glycosyltransferase